MKSLALYLLVANIFKDLYIRSQTIVGYPGDSLYTRSIVIPGVNANRNYFATISPISDPSSNFLQFGSLYSQFATNNSILGCTALNKGAVDFDTVCLLGASAATPTDFFLITFKSVFATANNIPSVSWPPMSQWQGIKLAPGKNYLLYPTDTKDELFILAAEIATSSTSTTLYFARILCTASTQKLSVNVDWTNSPQTLANYQLVLTPYTKLCSYLTDSLLIFTPLNSSKAYDNTAAGQPSNNKMVFLHWGSKLNPPAQVVSVPIVIPRGLDTPIIRIPAYVMDVEAINDLLYVSAVDVDGASPPQAVVIYLKVDYSNPTPQFTTDTMSGGQLMKLGVIEPTRRTFNHFLTMKGTTSLAKFDTLLFCHEQPSSYDRQKMYPIKFHLVGPNSILFNTNTSSFMRPLELSAEIKVLKLGIGNFQSNIAYLINGKLTYIDWVTYYQIQYNARNDVSGTVSIAQNELVRMTPSVYDFCSSFFNTGQDIQIMEKSKKKGYNLLCLKNNIVTMAWAGDSTTYNHILNFLDGGLIPNYTISTYIPYTMPGNTIFYDAQSTTVVSSMAITSLFTPIAYKPSSSPMGAATPQKNSIDIIKLEPDTVLGGDVSYSVVNPHPNMSFFFCKACDMKFVRDPQDTAPVMIDEIFMVSSGAMFEEINKNVGYMTCNDQIDFTAKLVQKNCKVRQMVSTGPWRLELVADRIIPCQAILFVMESRINSTRNLYYYDTKSTSIITVGTISGINSYQITCTNTLILVVGWQTGSETPSVVELVFNRTSSPPALVTPPNTSTGFGLKGLVNIRQGAFDGTKLTVTRWNNATNILEIEIQSYNDARGLYTRDGGFVEYRYLTGFGSTWDSVMLLYQYYIPYHQLNPNLTRQLTLFEGEVFSANYKYWSKLAINISEVGFTTIKKFFPHETRSVSCFSVWGIQTIVTGSVSQNYTLIVTFKVVSDPKSRLFTVYNTTKVYQDVIATDDNQKEIYFRVKEFQHESAFIKVILTDSILTAQYGMFPETSYKLVIRARNKQGFLDYNVSLNFQSVSKILVSPVKDLNYKQDLVLSLLPGMATKIEGHVTQIKIANGTGASILRSRLEPDPKFQNITSILIPSRSTPVKKPITASSFSLEAILLEEDAAVYFFKNMKFVIKCDISTIPSFAAGKTTQLVVQDTRASIDRIYAAIAITVEDTNQVYSFLVTNYSTTPVCHPVTRAVVNSDANIDLGATGKISLVPNTGLGVSNEFYMMRVLPSQPIEFFTEVLSTGANGVITIGYKNVVMESIPLPTSNPNPNPSQKIDGDLKSCAFLPRNTPDQSDIQVTICISEETANKSVSFYTINHLFSSLSAARVHKLSILKTQLPAFDDISKLECTIQSSLRIICGMMDIYSKVMTLSLIRDNTTGFCQTDTSFFCLKTDMLQKGYNLQSLVTSQNALLSPEFVVLTIRKRDNPSLLNAFVYMHNQTTGDIFFERNLFNGASNDGIVIGFFGKTNTLYLFEAASMRMSFYSIAEAQISFSSQAWVNLTSFLSVSNYDSSYGLNLSALFKPDAASTVPKTLSNPPSVPPKTIWQQYWWAIVGTGALMLFSALGYYLYRRELLKKENAKRDAALTIDSLDEFHYRR